METQIIISYRCYSATCAPPTAPSTISSCDSPSSSVDAVALASEVIVVAFVIVVVFIREGLSSMVGVGAKGIHFPTPTW